MIGFIVAVIAGFLTPYIDNPVSQPLTKGLGDKFTLEPGELRVVSFMTMMLVAAVIARILHSGTGVWLIVGGIIGYFLLRILAVIRSAIDGRKT